MHAAKHDVLDPLLVGRLPRKLKAVPREVRELDHRILLIVMPEDDQLFAERLLGGCDAQPKFRIGELGVNLGKRLLPDLCHGSKNRKTKQRRALVRTANSTRTNGRFRRSFSLAAAQRQIGRFAELSGVVLVSNDPIQARNLNCPARPTSKLQFIARLSALIDISVSSDKNRISIPGPAFVR